MKTDYKFYVYVLARPDGTPFYVGKGSVNRIDFHEYQARKGVKSKKCSIIRKIWAQGGQVQKYIVFTTDDEAEALAYEREMIALHERGRLANMTEGGEGTSGNTRIYTDEHRRNMSAAKQGHPVSAETRAKISAARKGRVMSAESRVKMSASSREHRTGATQSAETRAKISASMKGRVQTEQHRANNSAAQKARFQQSTGERERP